MGRARPVPTGIVWLSSARRHPGTLEQGGRIVTLPLDQLAARIDRGLDRVSATLEQRWHHKGGASCLERWSLRHWLLTSASAVLVALAFLAGLEGLRAVLAGERRLLWQFRVAGCHSGRCVLAGCLPHPAPRGYAQPGMGTTRPPPGAATTSGTGPPRLSPTGQSTGLPALPSKGGNVQPAAACRGAAGALPARGDGRCHAWRG